MGEVVRIDIQDTQYLTVLDNRHNYLGTRLAATGDMSRELFDILNNDGLIALP